jgi:PAS domain S-box-containing protein
VYELDAEGRFSFINNSVRLLGYDPADLAGRHFSVLLHEDDAQVVDRDSVLELFQGTHTGPALSPKLFNERRGVDRRTENREVRLRRKPGSRSSGDDVIATVIAYGEVSAAGEYDHRGEPGGFKGSVGVIRDITLRRKSEEMLRKLYQAVDQLSAGVLVADHSFVVEYVNPAFFRISGRAPQEVVGADLLSFFEFPPRRAQELRSLVREGFDAREEARIVPPRSEGDALPRAGAWAELHASPVRNPAGVVTHAILICEDVSQRKAMEELVECARQEAERANRAKSDFLASMSHELKSPVASVLAAARLIEMGGPEPERRAASIISSAQGLLDMLGDILDFVRFETGAGKIRQYAFPLAGFLERTCDPFRKAAEAKGLSFELNRVPDETIRSDPDRLGRALAAVLDNAISFTERGGVRVESSIERRSGNVPYIVIAVSDSGSGIAPEDQGRIFSPFVQLASPYSKRGGAGIGLSLARNIIRALGGEIRLQSEVGRGSSFTILVPAGAPAGADSAAPRAKRTYRLLVVDDNEVNLEYMAAILANAGHRADTAGSGAEALRLLEERPPDAALLDIQMPGMSGIELGRKVRSYTGSRYDPGLPLVALTAFDPDEVERSGAGFDAVFPKPVDVPKLLAAVDEAVDAREAAEGTLYGEPRPAAGSEAALDRARTDGSGHLAALKAAAAAGDQDAFRKAARSLATTIARMGGGRTEAALHRLALAFPDEDREVTLCRLDRIGAAWERLSGGSGARGSGPVGCTDSAGGLGD